MANLNLPNVREGGDIRFRIGLEDNGVAVDWSGLEGIRVFLYADAQKQVSGECTIEVDAEDNTVLACLYSGDDPQFRGINSVLVRAKYQGEIKVYDKPAINIVARTADADGVLVIDDPVVPVQINVEEVSTSLLNNAIDAAINAAAEAEKAIEDVRDEETAIQAAEAARVLAEQGRVSAEQSRVAQASADHTLAGQDHTRAESDHGTASDDHTLAVSDHGVASGDHTTALVDHSLAESDHTRAEADHGVASSDHTTAQGDHTQAGSDHSTAVADHTQAGADHTVAGQDHTQAGTDHNTAASDHTQAGLDHTQAGEDHTQALADHQVMAGYDNRLDAVEGEVDQLEAKVDKISIQLVQGGSIATGGTVGATIQLTPYSYAGWDYALVPCSEGDKIIINGTGGNNARLWCFVDSANKVLSLSDASATGTDLEVTAPATSAYCIINTSHSAAGACYFVENDSIIPRLNNVENDVSSLEDNIAELEDNVAELEDQVIRIPVQLVQDGSIATGGTVGATIELTPYSYAGWDYALVPCSEGDKIIINGTGGNNARLWCFVDSANKVLSLSDASATGTNLKITAPATAAYCIINTNHSAAGACYYIDNDVLANRVTDLEDVLDISTTLNLACEATIPKYINYNDGSETSSQTNKATGYVDVSKYRGKTIKYLQDVYTALSGTVGMAFYDSSKEFVSGVPCHFGGSEQGYEETTTVVPENATYARFTIFADYAREFYVKALGVYHSERLDNLERLVSDIPSVDFRLPGDVPKIYITSSLLTPDSTYNTIAPLTYGFDSPGEPVGSTDSDDVLLEFRSSTINFTDRIEINYQGSTSLADPQKNFSIDMAKKHKFGNWMEFDSFHLKGFYEEFIKCRDWVCNRMMEQIYRTRDVRKTRPFLSHNDFGADYRGFFGSNALCHVDGFPCELYINNEYWGLYVWRLKKHRNNYQFDKNDTNHVFIDAQEWKYNNGAFTWTGMEIRNPKSDSGNTSFPEKVEPNPGEVKTIIEAWETFLWGITSETAKADIEAHFNMDDFIDCYLLTYVNNIWDSWARNTLYGTWDGQHFSPMVYDMNYSFNGFAGKDSGSWTPYYPPTSETFNQKARILPWFRVLEGLYKEEIKSRYKELREIGIFSEKNILGLFEQFITWVGFDAYKRQAERWPDCPGYVGDNRDVDTMENLRAWVTARLQYMDSVMM